MFVVPAETIRHMRIEPGMLVADFGAGTGFYTIEAAKRVGNTGRVYAIDIQKELLLAIKKKAEAMGFDNVDIICADLEKLGSTRLADGSVHSVIISNILFQVEDKEMVIKEAKRILKEDGRISIVEWSDSFRGLGPAAEQVVAKDQAMRLFLENGFRLESEYAAGDHHYGINFIKKQ